MLDQRLTASGRLSTALATIRWTAADLAREARVDERTVRRWISGAYEPPERVVSAAENLAAFHIAHPIPPR